MGKTVLMGLGIGVLGGFLGGVVGIGGGIIMIPLMTAFAALPQKEAHGTSLVAVAFIGAVGAVTYYFHGVVDWVAALLLAASAILFARAGAIYAHSMQERRLKRWFGVFIMAVSILLVARGLMPARGDSMSLWGRTIVLLCAGMGTGFISGMMGVGGGSVMIPAMVILAGMEQHVAQGTSLLAMVPVGITGAFTHYRLGNVRKYLAFGLAGGAIAGGFVGGTVANRLPEFYLKLIFAVIGIWMGIKYLRK